MEQEEVTKYFYFVVFTGKVREKESVCIVHGREY
jgi:hypothetical protein